MCTNHVANEMLAQCIADALWGDGCDTPWSAKTLSSISDALMTYRSDLVRDRTEHKTGEL